MQPEKTKTNTEQKKKAAHCGVYFSPDNIQIYILSRDEESKFDKIEVAITEMQYNVYLLLGKQYLDPKVQRKKKQHPQWFSAGKDCKLQINCQGRKIHTVTFVNQLLEKVENKINQMGVQLQHLTLFLPPSYQYNRTEGLSLMAFNYWQKMQQRQTLNEQDINFDTRFINVPTKFLTESEAIINTEDLNSGQQRVYIILVNLENGENYISLIQTQNKLIKTQRILTIENLSGNHFDQLLIKYFVQKAKDEGFQISNNFQAMKELKQKIVTVKKKLNDQQSVSIYIHKIDKNLVIQRTTFEYLIKDIVQSMQDKIFQLLKNAKISPLGIKYVLTVGQTAEIPKIKHFFQNIFQQVRRAIPNAKISGLQNQIRDSYKQKKNKSLQFTKHSELQIMEWVCYGISILIKKQLKQILNKQYLMEKVKAKDCFLLKFQPQFRVSIEHDKFGVEPRNQIRQIKFSIDLHQKINEMKDIISNQAIKFQHFIFQELKKQSQVFLRNNNINSSFILIDVSFQLNWDKNKKNMRPLITSNFKFPKILPPTLKKNKITIKEVTKNIDHLEQSI